MVVGIGDDGVGGQEAPEDGVVDPPVHVDEAEVVELFVAGVASWFATGYWGALAVAVPVDGPPQAEGVVAVAFGVLVQSFFCVGAVGVADVVEVAVAVVAVAHARGGAVDAWVAGPVDAAGVVVALFEGEGFVADGRLGGGKKVEVVVAVTAFVVAVGGFARELADDKLVIAARGGVVVPAGFPDARVANWISARLASETVVGGADALAFGVGLFDAFAKGVVTVFPVAYVGVVDGGFSPRTL